GSRRGSDDIGIAARHPHRDPVDAAPAQGRRAAMTGRPANEPPMGRMAAADRTARRRYRRGWRLARGIAGGALGIALLIWTLLPVYNMMLIALDEEGDEFTGSLWPQDPS